MLHWHIICLFDLCCFYANGAIRYLSLFESRSKTPKTNRKLTNLPTNYEWVVYAYRVWFCKCHQPKIMQHKLTDDPVRYLHRYFDLHIFTYTLFWFLKQNLIICCAKWMPVTYRHNEFVSISATNMISTYYMIVLTCQCVCMGIYRVSTKNLIFHTLHRHWFKKTHTPNLHDVELA